MSLWDTSALVKLYAMEADSAQFQGLTAPGVPLVVARGAHYESHAVFRRREAEGSLPPGETAVLLQEISEDIAAGKMIVQADDAELEKTFGEVMDRRHSQTPRVFVRTNDALHIASALVAGAQGTTCSISPRNFSRRVTFFFPAYSDCAKLICCFMSATLPNLRSVDFPFLQQTAIKSAFP